MSGPLVAAAIEAGKTLEQALKDLLRMYGFLFFGGRLRGRARETEGR